MRKSPVQTRKRCTSAGLTAFAPPSPFHPLLSTAQLSVPPSILTVLLSLCPLPLPRQNLRQHLLHLKKNHKKKTAVDTIIPANLSTVCSVSSLEFLIQYSPILQRDQYRESSLYRVRKGFLKQKAEKQP